MITEMAITWPALTDIGPPGTAVEVNVAMIGLSSDVPIAPLALIVHAAAVTSAVRVLEDPRNGDLNVPELPDKERHACKRVWTTVIVVKPLGTV